MFFVWMLSHFCMIRTFWVKIASTRIKECLNGKQTLQSQRLLERFRDFFLGHIYLHSRGCKSRDPPLRSPESIHLYYKAKVTRPCFLPLLPHPGREKKQQLCQLLCKLTRIHYLEVPLMSPWGRLGQRELTQLWVIKKLSLIQKEYSLSNWINDLTKIKNRDITCKVVWEGLSEEVTSEQKWEGRQPRKTITYSLLALPVPTTLFHTSKI